MNLPLPAAPRTSVPADDGGVVLAWLGKLAVFLLVIGVIGADAIGIGSAKVGAASAAQDAAMAASTSWQQTHDLTQAWTAAQQAADQDGATVPKNGLTINTATGAASVTVRKSGRTILVRHIGPLKHWATQESTSTETDMP